MSQTVSVRRERVVASTEGPWVNDNLFNGSQSSSLQSLGSSSCNCLTQESISQGHKSPDYAAGPEVPEASKGQAKAADTLESYLGDPFDTSLLHLYVDHVARNIWEGKVYFFCKIYVLTN